MRLLKYHLNLTIIIYDYFAVILPRTPPVPPPDILQAK
jgi:hypothetical protein